MHTLTTEEFPAASVDAVPTSDATAGTLEEHMGPEWLESPSAVAPARRHVFNPSWKHLVIAV